MTKLTDRTDLRPETIALYQQLEKDRTACHPAVKAFMVLTLAPTAVITAGLAPIFLFALVLSPLALPKLLAMIAGIWTSPAALLLAPIAWAQLKNEELKPAR